MHAGCVECARRRSLAVGVMQPSACTRGLSNIPFRSFIVIKVSDLPEGFTPLRGPASEAIMPLIAMKCQTQFGA